MQTEYLDTQPRLFKDTLFTSVPDPILKYYPDLLRDLNAPRPQFAPEHDKTDNQDGTYLRKQVEYELREFALNQEVIFGQYEIYCNTHGNWDLRSPFQRSNGSFLQERFADLVKESTAYLRLKGVELTPEVLHFLSQNPKEFASLFSAQFMQTRVGLELAEWLGLHDMVEKITSTEDNSTIIIFSPYNPLRKTEKQYNWTMIADVVKDTGKTKHIRMTYVKCHRELAEYRSVAQTLVDQYQDALSPRYAFTSPFTIAEVVTKLGAENSPLLKKLFDQAIEAHSENIDTYVELLQSDSLSKEVKMHYLVVLEKSVVATHKQLVESYWNYFTRQEQESTEFSQAGYLKGGTCGFSPELGGTVEQTAVATGKEYGNPTLPDVWICKDCGAVHHIDNNDSSTYFENCQSCGASGRC